MGASGPAKFSHRTGTRTCVQKDCIDKWRHLDCLVDGILPGDMDHVHEPNPGQGIPHPPEIVLGDQSAKLQDIGPAPVLLINQSGCRYL